MVTPAPVVYRSGLTDSSRWQGFALRAGDIVVSTPSKCGTTWLQAVCALLVFQNPVLPGRLTALSPWLDMCLRPLEEVLAVLEAQTHRRVIKTHTPLDGLPAVDGVAYVVAGRNPLDVAVSLDHHRANLDRAVVETLLARARQKEPGEQPRAVGPVRPSDQRGRVLQWIHDERPPTENLHSLRAVVWHLQGAWARRDHSAVTLMHHGDLCRDLDGEMRRLADRLGVSVPSHVWPALVRAATLGSMRARATELVPDEGLGLFTDSPAFFRSGAPGQWESVLTDDDLSGYDSLLRSLAPPELIMWLEQGRAQRVS